MPSIAFAASALAFLALSSALSFSAATPSNTTSCSWAWPFVHPVVSFAAEKQSGTVYHGPYVCRHTKKHRYDVLVALNPTLEKQI